MRNEWASVAGSALLVIIALGLLVGCAMTSEPESVPLAPASSAAVPGLEGAPAGVEEAVRALGSDVVAKATYRELPDQVSMSLELDRAVEQRELFSLLSAVAEVQPSKNLMVGAVYPVKDGTGYFEGLVWSSESNAVTHLYGTTGRPAMEDGMALIPDSIAWGLDAAALARIAGGENPVPEFEKL